MKIHERGNRREGEGSGHVDFLHEEEIARYWKILAWPVACALLVIFFAVEFANPFEPWREWTLKGVMFVILTLRLRMRYQDSLAPLLFASALAGVVLGIGTACIRLAEHFALYKLFTLLTVPAATLLLGLAVSWVTFFVAKKFGTLHIIKLLPERQVK
jgi:hypothetical protein